MSNYFEALAKRLGNEYEIKFEDYKFKALAGKQKWIRVWGDDIVQIIRVINEDFYLPVFGVIEKDRKTLRLLDFGDDYKSWVNDKLVWDKKLPISLIPFQEGKFIYYNYNVLGELKLWLDNFYNYKASDIINTWEKYRLDLSIWISKITIYYNGDIDVTLILEPLKFIRKGIYLEHDIPQNTNKITTSFLTPFLKLGSILSKILKFGFFVYKLFIDRFRFLDFYEKKFLTRLCESELEIKYEPASNSKDFRARICHIINFFKNNEKFIKKAEENGYLKELYELQGIEDNC